MGISRSSTRACSRETERLLGKGSRRKNDEEWCFITSEMEKKLSCTHDMLEVERKIGIGNRPQLQIQNVKQEKSYKCKQCWRCRRRGPRGVGGNHLFQPSRKGAAKNAAKNADKNLANKTLKNKKIMRKMAAVLAGLTCFFGPCGIIFGGCRGRMVATLEWSARTWCQNFKQ